MTSTYAFLGGGNMATAMIGGLLKAGVAPQHITVLEIEPSLQQAHQARGLRVLSAPDAVLAQAQVWVLAVKPQQLKALCEQVAVWAQDVLIVSIAAGIRAIDIARWLDNERVVRAMPNTPALIGAGISGLTALDAVGPQDRDTSQQLLSTCGQTVWVDNEHMLDPVTALSGSGPAYVFLLMQSMIEAGMMQGLTAEQARDLTYSTVHGASLLAMQSTEDAQTLRERVTSKGGTTYAALQVLQEHQFPDIIAQAITAASARARQMADEFGK